ncbi:MAG: hypothetical protein SF052_12865, partial [Bacteroidia bacterium]|nr:hypothetical protein [Bacteroidia bacterium]
MKIYLRFTLSLLSVFLCRTAFAQLPANQPEQDCINALPVCQNVFVQPNSYQDEGLNPNEINANTSCLASGERNDTWYIFTTQTAGNVAFTITPATLSDDYDWAVYNLTNASCANIATNPALEVSCNYSGTPGATGPTGTGPGGFNPFNPVIPVNAGETYVVNVSNFTGSITGYTLDFSASTAVIFDNIPPEMQQPTVACGSTSIAISFNENVVCSSVDPGDFTVTGPGGPYTVTQVTGAVCQTGGTFENDYQIITTPPISTQGTFTISVVDTVLDNCDNVAIFNSKTVFISLNPVIPSASPSSICEGDQTTLTTNLATTPGYTFVWTPGNSTAPSITVSPFITTTYTVSATDPAGCVRTGTVTVDVKPLPVTFFTLPSQVCEGQFATLTYSGSSTTGTIFQWDFGGANTVIGTGGGPYQIKWDNPGQYTVGLNVIKNGCVGVPTSQNINVIEVPVSDFSFPAAVCVGDTAYITFTGTSPINANYVWNFGGATFVQNQSPPGGQGPYKVVWNTSGSKTICLQVDNQGCVSNLKCNTVVVNAIPQPEIAPVGNQCLGGNSFVFSYTGDLSDSYAWHFGADATPAVGSGLNPGTVSYLNAGVKTVSVVVSRNGCVSDTAKVSFEVIPEPSANFTTSSGAICADTCITFSYTGIPVGANQAYAWSFGSGAIPVSSSLVNPGCVDYTSGGIKTVTLTVNYKGCVASSSQTVTINSRPIVSAGPDVAFCEGDGGVGLNASVSGGTAPYFYAWTCSDPPNC